MSGEHHPVPFRWVLPVAQILLSVVMFWPLRHVLAWQIKSSINTYRGRPTEPLRPVFAFSPGELDSDSRVFVVDPHLLPPSPGFPMVDFESATDGWRYWTPLALNLPAGLLSVPYAIANPDKTEWTPKGMNFRYWRAISWPFVGLVFWWLAGRGIEALVAVFRGQVRPRLNVADLSVGILFVIGGLVLAVVPFGDRDPGTPFEVQDRLMVLSGVMWLLFGTATVYARVRQWRIGRRPIRPQDATAAPA